MSEILKQKKKKKSLQELKAEILEQKKKANDLANKRLKAVIKKERNAKSKKYLLIFDKYLDSMTEKNLETMTNYIISKFGKKEEKKEL